eukprot:g16355.t1
MHISSSLPRWVLLFLGPSSPLLPQVSASRYNAKAQKRRCRREGATEAGKKRALAAATTSTTSTPAKTSARTQREANSNGGNRRARRLEKGTTRLGGGGGGRGGGCGGRFFGNLRRLRRPESARGQAKTTSTTAANSPSSSPSPSPSSSPSSSTASSSPLASSSSSTSAGATVGRKRKATVLYMGMSRLPGVSAAYEGRSFKTVEKRMRDMVNEANRNPMRDTARVCAMESLGPKVRCVGKALTSDSGGEAAASPNFLAADITNTCSTSRGFLQQVKAKFGPEMFDRVFLDYFWMPDSVAWLNRSYMANNGGLVTNLVKMTEVDTRLLKEDFEIILPINRAILVLLLPRFSELDRHFKVTFLVGKGLEDLKQNHLALQADALIPEEIMQEVYGKGRDRQVSDMLGVENPTQEMTAVLLKYGVAAENLRHARFLKLTRSETLPNSVKHEAAAEPTVRGSIFSRLVAGLCVLVGFRRRGTASKRARRA